MPGNFLFVDMKVSSQHHPAWRARAIPATRVGLCSCVCLGVENISYVLNVEL